MPRIPRQDEPGSWHHVFNRGIARRTLFERRDDYRCFLAHLACAVRRGKVEVHAYCLMGTHYHLLLRSPAGQLAEAMQRIQLAYSRWFNRSRRRDGSLVRGRYGSRRVRSLNYRRILVRYVHLNPCGAHLAQTPSTYRWGSAWHYARGTGPPWLERGWVESEASCASDPLRARPAGRDDLPVAGDLEELFQLVETRLAHRDGPDPLDDIVSAASPSMRQWMLRKAILADGTRPGLPLLSISSLERLIEASRHEPWIVRRGRSERDGWDVAHVGLGRDLCGQSLGGMAARLGASETKVSRIYATHRAELHDETEYSDRVVSLAGRGVERLVGL